jgi:hypothetical protein
LGDADQDEILMPPNLGHVLREALATRISWHGNPAGERSLLGHRIVSARLKG